MKKQKRIVFVIGLYNYCSKDIFGLNEHTNSILFDQIVVNLKVK